MKLYGVCRTSNNNVELEVLEVERETAKFYFLEKYAVSFEHSRRISKDHGMIAFSPGVAVEKFTAQCGQKIIGLNARIKSLEEMITGTYKLL